MTLLLLKSLVAGPPLVGKLPEADRFEFEKLVVPEQFPSLNFRQKLGHIYEDALGILLSSSDHFELIQQSLQIQKDRHTTIGELDYLIKDLGSGDLLHLELATKFYLAVETKDGLLLPGPDARDNYYRKLKHLREHQLQLPKLYQEHLPERIRNQEIVSQHLIYGSIFDHASSQSVASPEFIHSHCRRGCWLHHSDVGILLANAPRLDLIPKAFWPVSPGLFGDLQLEEWNQRQRLDYCVMVRTPGDATSYFIAPDDYPNHGAGIR